MKISLSSLCLKALQDEDLNNLRHIGVEAIELVIFHQFGSYDVSKEMINFKLKLESRNIVVSGIQGFTYNPEVQLKDEFFIFSEVWKSHLDKVIRCAELFQTNKLIFGAPLFRDNINNENKFKKNFLHTAEYLEKNGIYLYLESTPKHYGANFLNTFETVVNFNKIHGLFNHFDTGCFLNEFELAYGINPIKEISVDHLHISSVNLGAICEDIVLRKWLNNFNLPISNDGFIVMESLHKNYKNSNLNSDINFLNTYIK